MVSVSEGSTYAPAKTPETYAVIYLVSDVLRHHKWVYCDGVFIINPQYEEEFKRHEL